MSNETLHKEIDLIQACVTRMANNSFLLKGWAISIVAVILALADKALEAALLCPVPRLSRHSVRPKLTPQVRRRLGRVKDAGLRPRASLVLDAVRARRRRGSIYEGKRSFPSVCDEGRVRGHATFRSAPVPAWRRSAGVCH